MSYHLQYIALIVHPDECDTLSVGAMLVMLTMGWVRETARTWNGYLIYGVMSFEDERRHYQPAAENRDDPHRN